MDRPPPPYSETDIYSNSGRSPLSPHPNLSRSTTLTDDASQASTVNSVIYTPAESVNDDTYTSAARLYFDSRPYLRPAPSRIFSHEVTIGPMSTPADIPYIPEFADLDITTQDWATFVNYVIPHHIDHSNGLVAREKMKAEVLDRRMQGLTLSSERSTAVSAADAQLNSLQPSQVNLSSPQEDDVIAVVFEWNSGFFEPRGVHILATVSESDQPTVQPKDTTTQPAVRAVPCRTGWHRHTAGPETVSDREGVIREREPRGWGWGPHGPGHRGGRGRDHHHGRDGCRGVTPQHGPTRSGRRGGLVRADASGFHVGRIMSAEKDGFRLGPMVADKSGFRIGNVFVANDDGFKLGGMKFGNTYHPGVPPPNPWATERGRDVKDGRDKKNRDRSRSISSRSASSDDTVGTEESEGSLPDVSDLKANQLPVMKQNLMEWLNHPEQPVSKETVKSLKKDLKLAKWARKPEGQELAELKAELKALAKAFKELRKSRAVKLRSLRKERRKQRKELKSQAKQKRKEEKAARKSQCKGKGRATATEYDQYDEYLPCETGLIHNITSIPGFPNGPPGIHIPGSFPEPDFNPLAQGAPRSLDEAASVHAKREYLEREAERVLSDAHVMHAEAEETRRKADLEQDEKSTLKLLDVAKDLDVEVEKLFEAADRLIAESVQLEEYLKEMENGNELPPMDTSDKAYIRRMRQTSGVSI